MKNGNYHSAMYKRDLDLKTLLGKKSYFLFGPRATGKSHLIRRTLKTARVYDLLEPVTYARLLRHPESLEEELFGHRGPIVVDEVQKLPALLDLVHRLIEQTGRRFLLTGSSARKLRRGQANLLAGRARTAEMFPLTSREIADFDLLRYLNRGGLPAIYDSDEPEEDLRSYVSTYLQEEIQAEALTRRVDHFARFLEVMALSNGGLLDYAGISRDTGIQAKTVRNYVDILVDTLLAFEVPAFRKTKTRKAVTSSKVFLFDVGVVGALSERGPIRAKSELFGRALEHFIALELRAYLSYRRKNNRLCHWRSTSQFEVDFVVDGAVALEVKATQHVDPRDLRGLRAFREEGVCPRSMVVSTDPERRRVDGIDIVPVATFLDELWRDRIV